MKISLLLSFSYFIERYKIFTNSCKCLSSLVLLICIQIRLKYLVTLMWIIINVYLILLYLFCIFYIMNSIENAHYHSYCHLHVSFLEIFVYKLKFWMFLEKYSPKSENRRFSWHSIRRSRVAKRAPFQNWLLHSFFSLARNRFVTVSLLNSL